MMENMVTMNISLDEKIVDELKKAAREAGRPLEDLAVEALVELSFFPPPIRYAVERGSANSRPTPSERLGSKLPSTLGASTRSSSRSSRAAATRVRGARDADLRGVLRVAARVELGPRGVGGRPRCPASLVDGTGAAELT
jgi:hypothetical protein